MVAGANVEAISCIDCSDKPWSILQVLPRRVCNKEQRGSAYFAQCPLVQLRERTVVLSAGLLNSNSTRTT